MIDDVLVMMAWLELARTMKQDKRPKVIRPAKVLVGLRLDGWKAKITVWLQDTARIPWPVSRWLRRSLGGKDG